MSRRAQIRMTDEEVRSFLDQTKTIILCSAGKDGFPHPMPMWLILNLKQDPRVSLLAEEGETYVDLRGVVIRGNAEIDTDLESVLATFKKVGVRMGTVPDEDSEAVREGVLASARKRCVIRVQPESVVSWDHRKLGGVY